MKKYIIAFFLLVAGTSYAQPAIDHMLIDESNGELQIFGAFGSAHGKVWVDSVNMTIENWTDSLITVSIPDTGRGSAGPVVVGAMGYQSNARVITAWGLYIFYMASLLHSLGPEETKVAFNLNWRLDIHSYLKTGRMPDYISFEGIRSSTTSQGHYTSAYDPQTRKTNNDSTIYIDTAYSYVGEFHPNEHRVDFYIGFKVYDVLGAYSHFQSYCRLDSSFKIIPFDTAVQIQPSAGWREQITPVIFAFPPPQKAMALQNAPYIVDPANHSGGIGTDNILLRWDSLALMDRYHLQVSLDSVFNSAHSAQPQIQSLNTIVDTIITATEFTIARLSKNTKYFWRVAGLNSEGESRWSDVWSFTTGATAAVKDIPHSIFTFSAFPNPAADKLNIIYSSPGVDVSFSLFDLLGNKVREIRQNETGSETIEFPLTGLPVGVYLLRATSEDIRKSLPIIIVR